MSIVMFPWLSIVYPNWLYCLSRYAGERGCSAEGKIALSLVDVVIAETSVTPSTILIDCAAVCTILRSYPEAVLQASSISDIAPEDTSRGAIAVPLNGCAITCEGSAMAKEVPASSTRRNEVAPTSIACRMPAGSRGILKGLGLLLSDMYLSARLDNWITSSANGLLDLTAYCFAVRNWL